MFEKMKLGETGHLPRWRQPVVLLCLIAPAMPIAFGNGRGIAGGCTPNDEDIYSIAKPLYFFVHIVVRPGSATQSHPSIELQRLRPSLTLVYPRRGQL